METWPNHGLGRCMHRRGDAVVQPENALSKVFTPLFKGNLWEKKTRRAKRARKFFENIRSFIAEKWPYHAIISQVRLVH